MAASKCVRFASDFQSPKKATMRRLRTIQRSEALGYAAITLWQRSAAFV
jgi:hypothetical protein